MPAELIPWIVAGAIGLAVACLVSWRIRAARARRDEPALVLRRPSGGTSPIGDSVPLSQFVDVGKVVLAGDTAGLLGLCVVSTRKDGMLPTTKSDEAVLELRIQVHNRSQLSKRIAARSMSLTTRDGKAHPPFPGEVWSSGFVWLGPKAIEHNGNDTSERRVDSLDLKSGDSGVFEVSFPMPQRMTEADAIGTVDTLIVRST
jgi:hypothetical protein